MKLLTFLNLSILITLTACSNISPEQMETKKFKMHDNTAVFTTRFVIVDKKEITMVTHEEEDGAWQFFSDDKFDNFEDVAAVVSLGQIIQVDSTILEIDDLPKGFAAKRKNKGDKWVISKSK